MHADLSLLEGEWVNKPHETYVGLSALAKIRQALTAMEDRTAALKEFSDWNKERSTAMQPSFPMIVCEVIQSSLLPSCRGFFLPLDVEGFEYSI